jgi:hypothetical protein
MREGTGQGLTQLLRQNDPNNTYHKLQDSVSERCEEAISASELDEREGRRTSANELGLLPQRELRDSLVPALQDANHSKEGSRLTSSARAEPYPSASPFLPPLRHASSLQVSPSAVLIMPEEAHLDDLADADLGDERLVPVPGRVELVAALRRSIEGKLGSAFSSSEGD